MICAAISIGQTMRRKPKTLSFRGLIFPAIHDFNRHRGSFIFFGILFGALNSLVLAPAFALLFGFIAHRGGGGAVTNEEIFDFFLSPVGVGATLFVIAAVMTTTMTQQAGLMMVFANLRRGTPVGWIRALLAMLSSVPGIRLINIVRAIVLLLVLLPFTGAGAYLFFRFLAGYDLNYLVQVRPPAFWWAAAVSVVLTVAAGLCVLIAHTRVIFAFPAYFFGRMPPLQALRRSFSLAGGHTWGLVRIFIFWVAVVGLLNLALGALLDRLGPSVVPLASRDLNSAVVVIGGVLIFDAIARAALNLVTFGVQAIVVTRAYVSLCADDDLAIPDETRSSAPHDRRIRWAIAALAVVYLIGVHVTVAGLLENLDLADSVSIVAHRGASMHAPENTLAAIQRAIDDGANYAEIDVQETADGVVVVLHDTDLRRTGGVQKRVWEVTYDEIRELDVGSWFSVEFAGKRIPTLGETIALAGGRIRLIIEIKLHGHEKHLVENVVRIIEESGLESHCILASLNRGALEKAARLNPRLKRGYLAYQTMGRIQRIDADYLMVETRLATPLAIRSAHDAGKRVFVWTVNDAARMSVMIERGVDGIMTDDPGLLAEVLEQRAELTELERLVLRFSEVVSR